MIMIMIIAFVFNLALTKPDPVSIGKSFVPLSVSIDHFDVIAALVATAFVLYCAIYQSYLVQDKKWKLGNLKNSIKDTYMGIFMLSFISALIILTSTAADEYKKNLKDLIKRFREDLNNPNVPFVIDQMRQFPGEPLAPSKKLINEAHLSIAKESVLNSFVSSDGLTFNSDSIHFDARSQREFRRRYAEVYLKVAE